MRAAVLNQAPGKLEIEELTLDSCEPQEVRVRVEAMGLCHSDLHEMEGTFPTVFPTLLGHEAAGIVEEVGADVRSVRPGDRVVSCLTQHCGRCRYCVTGRLVLCANRSDLRRRSRPALTNKAGVAVHPTAGLGAFAEAMLVHESGLVRIPEAMPFDRACLLGCAVITGVSAVFRAAKVEPGATVAVFGCGGVGMAAVQGARLAGASRVIAVDLSRHKLDQAVRLGATDGIDARETDAVAALRDLTGGGVDYSFEAVGLRATVEQSFAALAPGGLATVIGMVPDDQPIRIPGSQLFYEEKRLQGSFMGSNQFPVDIPRLADLYLQGRLLLDEMVSERIALDDINEGFTSLRSGEVTRVVAVHDTSA